MQQHGKNKTTELEEKLKILCNHKRTGVALF